jgi:hypothetical protein
MRKKRSFAMTDKFVVIASNRRKRGNLEVKGDCFVGRNSLPPRNDLSGGILLPLSVIVYYIEVVDEENISLAILSMYG